MLIICCCRDNAESQHHWLTSSTGIWHPGPQNQPQVSMFRNLDLYIIWKHLFASLSFHNPPCHCLSYTFYEVKKRQCPLLMYPYSLFFAGSGYLRIAHPERTMKKPALIYYWRIEVPSQISWLLETFWKSIIIINVSSFESYGLRSCLGVRHISHLWVCLSVRLQ